MRDLTDLKFALQKAAEMTLIDNFSVQMHYLDIDFHLGHENRTPGSVDRILILRDFIRMNYREVVAADYMPLLNRLRLYGNFQRIK